MSERLFAVADLVRSDFASAAAGVGLTPQQARTVLALEKPRPMRALAAHLACDASNVTGLADRLEELDVVSRVQGDDRRVKVLQLTPHGEGVRAELLHRLDTGSSMTRRLDAGQRTQLAALLDELLGRPPLD